MAVIENVRKNEAVSDGKNYSAEKVPGVGGSIVYVNTTAFPNTEFLTWDEGVQFTGMSKDTFRKFCDQIGATRYFAKRIVRFSKSTILAYLASQNPEQVKAERSSEFKRTHAEYFARKAAQKK